MILNLILIVFLVLLDPFVGISLTVTVLVATSFHLPYRYCFALAFMMGLISDLSEFRWLGISSLVLVTASLIIYIVKEQFDISGTVVVIAIGVLGELVYRIINQDQVNLSSLLIQGMVVWLVWRIFGLAKPKGGVYLRT